MSVFDSVETDELYLYDNKINANDLIMVDKNKKITSSTINVEGLNVLKQLSSTALDKVQFVKGVKGDTGATGPRGLQGETGAQGIQGPKGDVGLTGPKGDTGAQGLDGAKGATGATGAQGIQGLKGDIGLTGPKGDTGAQGIQGPKGDVGLTGPKGDTGAKGLDGVNVSGLTANSFLKVNNNSTAVVADTNTYSVSSHSHHNEGFTNMTMTTPTLIGDLTIPTYDSVANPQQVSTTATTLRGALDLKVNNKNAVMNNAQVGQLLSVIGNVNLNNLTTVAVTNNIGGANSTTNIGGKLLTTNLKNGFLKTDTTGLVSTDTSSYALSSHTHTEYAPSTHNHDTLYASRSHTHIDYDILGILRVWSPSLRDLTSVMYSTVQNIGTSGTANGMKYFDGQWNALAYTPTNVATNGVFPVPHGQPYYFYNEANNNVTFQIDRTSLSTPLLVSKGNMIIFVFDSVYARYNYIGQISYDYAVKGHVHTEYAPRVDAVMGGIFSVIGETKINTIGIQPTTIGNQSSTTTIHNLVLPKTLSSSTNQANGGITIPVKSPLGTNTSVIDFNFGNTGLFPSGIYQINVAYSTQTTQTTSSIENQIISATIINSGGVNTMTPRYVFQNGTTVTVSTVWNNYLRFSNTSTTLAIYKFTLTYMTLVTL